jgi:hypothetical protein
VDIHAALSKFSPHAKLTASGKKVGGKHLPFKWIKLEI